VSIKAGQETLGRLHERRSEQSKATGHGIYLDPTELENDILDELSRGARTDAELLAALKCDRHDFVRARDVLLATNEIYSTSIFNTAKPKYRFR
jgi:hypothetical protein